MRVLKDIHLVENTTANVYIVEIEHLVAIDAGLPESLDKVLNYVNELGRKPEDLSLIIVTHGHYDHVGALRKLKEVTGAKVAAHRDEVDYVEGQKQLGRYRAEPVKVDIVLSHGDVLFNRFEIVHTPGHTPGSICILDRETKALFVGDLVYEDNGRLYEIPHEYSLDPVKNREAIAQLLELDFKHVLPSHGKPLLNRGREALQQLVNEVRGV